MKKKLDSKKKKVKINLIIVMNLSKPFLSQRWNTNVNNYLKLHYKTDYCECKYLSLPNSKIKMGKS